MRTTRIAATSDEMKLAAAILFRRKIPAGQVMAAELAEEVR